MIISMKCIEEPTVDCQAFEIMKEMKTDMRDLATRVGLHNELLAKYNVHLEEHMKRSSLLEEQNVIMRKDHAILANKVDVIQRRVGIIWMTPGKIIFAIITLAAGIPGVMALISWIKEHIVFK